MRKISYSREIPAVVPDGIFGQQTKTAVEEFQKLYGLEVTGEADAEPAETLPADTDEGTIAGIPVKHIVLFAGGLVLAVGALVGIHVYQKRSGNSNNSDDDDDV